jgi:predicted nuclease of predicted toxin-antitoxin system
MRLLANENFPRVAVEALRAEGHDVAWVRIDAPGIPDEEVIARAVREDRILLTLDKDFGTLAFGAGLPATSGVVLFRVFPPLPARVTALALGAVRQGRAFEGRFVVVTEGRIRERLLPQGGREP